MKYKEFKSEIDKMGLKISRRSDGDYILEKGEIEWGVASISNRRPCRIDTQHHYINTVDEQTFRKLFRVLTRFAQTGIEERGYDDE